MGKKEIHVVRVPRWVTVTLLIAVSAMMVLVIDLLSGHAYRRQASLPELLSMVRRHDIRPSNSAFLANLAPVVANVLFFVPWGALAFLSFDVAGASRRAVYAATIAVGVAFALGLAGWQEFLPTRVTAWQDVIWNAAGCVGGAALGHLRKRVRIRFD